MHDQHVVDACTLVSGDERSFSSRDYSQRPLKTGGSRARVAFSLTAPTRHVRMVIEQVGTSTYEFEVFSTDGVSGTIKEQIAVGDTKSLAEATSVAEDYAMEYLAREIEKATVPFWLEETI